MTERAADSEENDDLSEFHDVFFDEVDEHLASMETLLLKIVPSRPERDDLDAIFRAAHSIKGGAAVFGFEDMAALTHEMETAFDRVRKGTLVLSPASIDAFLRAGDLLETMLADRRAGQVSAMAKELERTCDDFRAMLVAGTSNGADTPIGNTTAQTAPVPGDLRLLEIILDPIDGSGDLETTDAIAAGLASFGRVERVAASDGPDRIRVRTHDSLRTVGDALGFVVDPARFHVREVDEAKVDEPTIQPPSSNETIAPDGPPPSSTKQPTVRLAVANDDAASIRVSIQKVDQLINLVGELVITQSMLAETASLADSSLFEALASGLSQLQRNTRDLQEAAMSIRMMPMSFAFSRFPRMVRDVAAKLGKDVELVTIGEHTELDKGLIERIVDPLTHLVRNSLDHGIEPPDERIARGKPAVGKLSLRAYHQGGAIVIEVSDDGRGLDRERILAKARERGMSVSESMSDAEVWQLIFEAGFSTAAVVTDVSGRGVGMDVVKRNILALGGRVQIDSESFCGTRITIRLPLTLAILDGLSVGVGDEQYIIPLTYIVESLQPAAADLKMIAGRGRVVHVRGEYLPVVALHEIFGIRSAVSDAHRGILVILESQGHKTALLVDTLIGQHQVVIKSLESNYRRIRGISGATIMGNGKVALILDAIALAEMARPLLAA